MNNFFLVSHRYCETCTLHTSSKFPSRFLKDIVEHTPSIRQANFLFLFWTVIILCWIKLYSIFCGNLDGLYTLPVVKWVIRLKFCLIRCRGRWPLISVVRWLNIASWRSSFVVLHGSVLMSIDLHDQNSLDAYAIFYMCVDGLWQDCGNSGVWAMELLQSCTEPTIYILSYRNKVTIIYCYLVKSRHRWIWLKWYVTVFSELLLV